MRERVRGKSEKGERSAIVNENEPNLDKPPTTTIRMPKRKEKKNVRREKQDRRRKKGRESQPSGEPALLNNAIVFFCYETRIRKEKTYIENSLSYRESSKNSVL